MNKVHNKFAPSLCVLCYIYKLDQCSLSRLITSVIVLWWQTHYSHISFISRNGPTRIQI